MESPSTANVVRLDSHPRRSRSQDAKLADRSVERPLSAHDLFFSTTDEKGVITAGNQVFARVSGYALEEMVGRAHNIVRHPDMPRAVFQILWDTIKAGQPVAAYVKNRTADGAYYWVLASVMPITGGYLSVRLAPGGEHFAIAKSIYGELVALEREVEGDDVRQRKPSIEASVSRLGELLADAGYEDYRAFIRAALPAEVTRRAGRLAAGHRQALATAPGGAPQAVAEILDAYGLMSDFLDALVTDLARYAQVGRSLGEQSSYLRAMGDDVRLFALNAQIGASRLGDQGAALDAVARLLTEQSQATSPLVATVAERAASAVREIEDMTFQLSLSTVQAEMIAVFAHELADGEEIHEEAARNMLALADALQHGSDRTFAALTAVARQLSDVLEHVGHVGVGIDRLARLSLNGRVELASVPDAGSISTLFSDVERQVGDARQRLAEFATIEEVARDLERAAGHDAMHAAATLHDSAATLAAPPAVVEN
jgi:PAS domain S-box-containing protein